MLNAVQHVRRKRMKQVAEFYPSVTSLVQAVCSDRREKPLGQNERAGTQDKTKSVNLAID